MQKVLDQPRFALEFLQKQVDYSQEQIFQFKNQLVTLHSICLQFTNNLGDQYVQLVNQYDDGDEFKTQLQNQFANYILATQKEAEIRAHNIYEESVEPVMHFEENFIINNLKALQDFSQIIEELTEQRILLKEYKSNHFLALGNDQNKQKRPIFEQVTQNTNLWNKKDNKPQDTAAKQVYDTQIQKVNNLWKNLQKIVPRLYETCQLNEDSRLNFMNNSMVNFVQLFSHFLRDIPNHDQILEKIKTASQKSMKQKQNVKETLFNQMLLLYKGDKKPLQTIYVESIPNSTPQKYVGMRLVHQIKQSDDAFQQVTQHLKLLISSKKEMYQSFYNMRQLSNMSQLNNYLKNLTVSAEQRTYFMDELLMLKQLIKLKQDTIEIKNPAILHIYKQLFIKLFQSFENELKESGVGFQRANDYLQFMQILMTTFHLKFIPIRGNEFQSIISIISPQCNLFYSMQFWRGFYDILSTNKQWLLNFKKVCSIYINENVSMNSSAYLDESQRDLISSQHVFKNLISHATKLIVKNKPVEASSKPGDILQTVNMIIIVTSMNPEFSSQVILSLAKSQNIKQNECLQWIELQEGNQMLKPMYGFTPFRSKQQTKKVQKAGSKLNYCVKLSMPYLSFREQFIKIIMVNKHFSLAIRKAFIKAHLLHGQPNTLRIRIMSWKTLLVREEENLPSLIRNYLDLPKDRHVEHLIDVDIKRSFNTNVQNNQIERDKLIKNIEKYLGENLKAFAYNNPSISYYQGMNMLMGFFIYSCWEDQNIQLAYNLFKGLIDLLLKEVFMHGLKKLRIHFFTLDKLIALHIPQLFKHWKLHKIECGQYATVFFNKQINKAWYITLFTYGLQVNNKIQIDGDNKIIFEIMDIIVSKGWVGFYQITLGILNFYKDLLLQFDFGQSLNFLNHLTKSGFFYYPIQDIEYQDQQQFINFPPLRGIKTLANNYSITKQNLWEIEKDYYQLREKIDQIVFQDK